jgi:hypothetical protein
MKRVFFAVFSVALLLTGTPTDSTAAESIIWRVEDAQRVGGEIPEVLGTPRAVTEDREKALRFNGATDGLIVAVNPLEGLRAFTIEVRFKPDGDGPEAQRFVHIEDTAQNRGLIETRVTRDRQWYLDTFLYAHPKEPGLTLVDRTKLHPCDRWYWAALVYDGKVMAHFVDGQKEREGNITFGPMVAGRTSLGVRLNQVFWFKGAMAEVRFHPRALRVTELQHAK